MGIRYRPEIDGLRAIAVLAVVAYHARLGGAGFVGVDVFFVISGYLITSLLLREQADTGRIDLLAFYARRVRRIFPAAVLVVLSVLAVARLLLAGEAFVHTANSAGASALFGANFYFQAVTGGYWSADSEQMPLLHLWSLAVEEQFYLLWPALLIFIPRRRVRPVLIGLAVASLVLAEWLVRTHPTAAFYQMPARFWELAAGGLIATLPQRPMPRWSAAAGVLVTLGACLVPMPTFPGVGALPAVLGAAMVILASHGGTGNALLRSRPMVAVGLISYSLYLWHWPLLAFYRATSIGEGALQVRLALCAAAFVLAFASYRYVEQPFRRARFRSGRTVAVGATLSAVVALSACAVGLRASDEQERMLPDPRIAAIERDVPSKACHSSGVDDAPIKCQPRTHTIVWGDSIAWSWLPGIRGGSDLTRDGCPPVLGYGATSSLRGDQLCHAHNAAVAKLAAGADTLILAARWVSDGDFDLRPTLRALDQVPRVIVIGPTPEIRDKAAKCVTQGAMDACAQPRAEFDAQAGPILAKLRAQAAPFGNVAVYDMADRFCTAAACPPAKDGTVLYWDQHHISASAARKLFPAPAEGPGHPVEPVGIGQ